MNRAVRGLAFIAVALAHVALVSLLLAPVREHVRSVADDTRMVVVFIESASREAESPLNAAESAAHRGPGEPPQSTAPLLPLHAPAVDPTPSGNPALSATSAPSVIDAPSIIPTASSARDSASIDSSGPISAPTDAASEISPPAPPIDWQQETRTAAARMAESLEAQRRRNRKFTPDPRFARAAARPQFGWDRSKTHRVESLPAGGTLIHLNDRCALVLSGLILPICEIGRIPARGDLFEHIGGARASDDEP